MIMLTPDDEITSGEELVNLADVRARIDVLRPWKVADTRLGINDPVFTAFASEDDADAYIAAQGENLRSFLTVDEYAEEAEELTALRDLLTAMEPLGERASAISEDYLMQFLTNELEDLYGQEVFATMSNYINWNRYRDDRANEMTRFIYRDGMFYLIA
jgi:hypothetical protein